MFMLDIVIDDSVFIVYNVIYTNLEITLILISLNLTFQISWSAPAHQLRHNNCHLILHFTFTHCVVIYLYDMIKIP